ncbi:MAG: hypothetical protein LC794_17695 [Acidobacteria bacterium]|nr:hypothetical protein [Acidobacteriota bacterium]
MKLSPGKSRWFFLIALLSSVALISAVLACKATTWELVTTDEHPHSQAFVAVQFSGLNHGWGLTPTALFETNDGGRSWTSLTKNAEGNITFFSVEFVDNTTGFIVGSQQQSGNARSPIVLRTDDLGKNWRESIIKSVPTTTDQPRLLHSVSFCDRQVGWAAGSDLVLKSIDSGQTWERFLSDSDENLFSVACLSRERAVVVGQNGLILVTTDGGKSWTRQASGTSANLVRVRAFDDDIWIVGGIDGKSILLHSHRLSGNWESQRLEVSETLFDIYISNTRGWAVGSNGLILHTIDGWRTWERQESPTKNNLFSLFFLSPNRGWASGDHKTILRQ